MLYNIELKKVKQAKDCCTCPHYDNKMLKCNGLNKACFEYDETTNTIIDGLTGLPIKNNFKEN